MAAGIVYGTDRLLLDDFRADATRLGLIGSQWTGLLFVASGIGVLAGARSRLLT